MEWNVVLACSLLLKAWHADAARPLSAEQLCTSSSGYPSGHAAISTALLVIALSRLVAGNLNTAQLYQQTCLMCALAPVAPCTLPSGRLTRAAGCRSSSAPPSLSKMASIAFAHAASQAA